MTQLYLITLAIFALISMNKCDKVCNPEHIKEEMEAKHHHHVDYSKGGENWQEEGGICEKHNLEAPDQSPIDIKTDKTVKDDDKCDDGDLDWDVEWDHKRFKVENNCHTLQVTPVDEHERALTSSRDVIAKLKVDDTPFDDDKYEKYCLSQFHFHWGSDSSVGSEHLIDGFRFPLEVHFVHYACKFGNFSAAQDKGNKSSWESQGHAEHTLAVVSVLFEATPGKNNPAFEALLSSKILDKLKICLNEVVIESDDIKILKELVPEKFEDDGYYAYKGGLTTPPCTDDVKWFIGKKFGYVSPEQLTRFRQLLDDDCKPILRNWRNYVDNPNPVYDCAEDNDNDNDNGDGNNGEGDNNNNGNGDNGDQKPKITVIRV